jgi:flagella basal body P-ring formation protein FlgA
MFVSFIQTRTARMLRASVLLVLAPGSGLALDATPSLDPVAPPVAQAPAASPTAPRKLEQAELTELLIAWLNQNAARDGAEWEVHLSRPWAPITVPGEPLDLAITEPAPNRITSSSIFRFELRSGQKVIGSYQVAAQVRLWAEVVVAQRGLNRGTPVLEAALGHERRDLLQLRNPLTDLPANAAAFEIAESVQAGAALHQRAVRLRPVVFRGQTAEAVVREGSMIISQKVEVLEEGVPGQMIRVRNLQSRRELRGKVQDEQTIVIGM